MENMPSVTEAGYHYPGQYPAAEVPGEHFDLSTLVELDDWAQFPSDRSIKPDPIPVPKPDPDAFLPEFEANYHLPPQFYYPQPPQGPLMASPYPPNQQLTLSQPPTPAAECQVSSTMSPVATSPFSAQSDGSFDCEHGQDFGEMDDIDLGDINLKGLTEEQLVSLTARDLNRLCRDMPDDVIKQLKKRRRTLKNRGYAYNSRVRRVTQKNVLEQERDDLKKQLHQMSDRCRLLEREMEQWKMRAQSLERSEI